MNITVPKRMLHTYKEVFFDETYTKYFSDLDFSSIKTVVDIGANVGYFSLFVLTQNKSARVFAFEPMPNNFKQLSAYRKENASLALTAFNVAVGDKKGSIHLNYDESDSFTTAASILDVEGQPNQIEVPTTTLQAIFDENNIDVLDFLKLDCEGSEYNILYSASPELLKKVRIMSMETHVGKGKNENQPALVKFLKGQGFEVAEAGANVWAWRK